MTMVFTCQIHEQRLKAKGNYSDAEVKRSLEEVDKYRKIHQDNPGFFDTAINTGNTALLNQWITSQHTQTLLLINISQSKHWPFVYKKGQTLSKEDQIGTSCSFIIAIIMLHQTA